ncbi:hypothetical protein CDV55_103827 [Aspergillus turcosus]|nr:hypothetical protein CDV55_103827 [Aspergillus turcosus]
MPPSSGHLLLPKFWRAARFAYEKALKTLKAKFPEPTQQVSLRLQPAYARIPTRQPISRAAAIRQSRSNRYFSTRAAGSFVSSLKNGLQGDRAAYRQSRVAANIGRLTSRAPFASTLRPNLTGGTLGRTAGGYAIGAGRIGGARYFSHGPASPAQVINNVSMGVRAFFLSGQKARFDGIDPITGQKRYKAVSALQDQAERKMAAIPRMAPGSFIDFQISPTITAFGVQKKAASAGVHDVETLNSDTLSFLSADFARALKDLAAVLNDLKRLSSLGNLPIILHDRSTIRVRFPGCDAETVERLCDEVGVQRGRISQDEDFNLRTGADLALLFPFAPSVSAPSDVAEFFFPQEASEGQSPEEVDWQAMMTSEDGTGYSPENSRKLSNGLSFEDSPIFADKNPWVSSSSGYSSINVSELGDRAFFPEVSSAGFPETASEYEGVEGIYRKRCLRREELYQQLAPQLASPGFDAHFIVDTGRNGKQPTGQLAWGDWCNVIDTGFGVRPTTDTGDKLADVFVWVKPGGESDGTSDTSAKRYDVKCGLQDALKPAPEAGTWFQAYFEQLLRNANPSFWTRPEDHWMV